MEFADESVYGPEVQYGSKIFLFFQYEEAGRVEVLVPVVMWNSFYGPFLEECVRFLVKEVYLGWICKVAPRWVAGREGVEFYHVAPA